MEWAQVLVYGCQWVYDISTPLADESIVISWKRNLYAIWVAELLAIAGFGTSMPIIPFYLQDIGVTDPNLLKFWVGLIQSVAAVGLGLVAPVWGRVADSYGRRPMLLRAMFGGGIAVVLMAFVTQPWQLLALRTCQGLLAGTVGAATVLVAATVPESQTGFGMGMLTMAVFTGNSIGPMLGGFISDAFGNRITFIATALMLFVAGIVVLGFVREDFIPPPESGQSFFRKLVPDFSSVFGSPALITLIVISFCVQVSNSVANPILPLFVQQLSTSAATVASVSGVIIGLGAFTAAIAAAGIGKISYNVGYQRTLLICLIGSFVLQIPQGFVHNTTQLLILRAIAGFFLGGTMPAVNALIAQNTPRETQGSVYGINTSVSSAGMALGPAIGAIVAVSLGYAETFIAAGIILFIATGFTALRRRQAESKIQPGPAPNGGETGGREAATAARESSRT